MGDTTFILLVVVWLISAFVAAIISDRKHTGAATGFLMGLILGVFGILIVALWKPGMPPAPGGMRAVKCPRCNAIQNVGLEAPTFDCWQCHLNVTAPPTPYELRMAAHAAKKNPAATPVAAVAEPPAESKRVVNCPLCDAEQHIPAAAPKFRCGQCRETVDVPA